MTKTKRKFDFARVKQSLPYLAVAILVIAIAAVGAFNKQQSEVSVSLDTFADNSFDVSVDQLSELYMVADLSDALGLASAQDVASNYVVANTMYASGQTAATPKMEKPTITDVPSSRGVIQHVVKNGETMESIAAQYGVTTDQIRWSNDLKTTTVSPGMTLYIPSSSGIVYQVAAGDTVESIASRYGSSVDEIIALNDLELSGLSEGMRIVIKDGTLPVTERPEYTAPVTTSSSSSTYSYLGNTSERQNIVVLGYRYDVGNGNPYVAGQCTSWAWYMRQDLPHDLGNASTWADRAAAKGYIVNHTPSAGAVFQTANGGYGYGHVGYVESVNADGSIVVTEMNYYGVAHRVIRAIIPASAVGRFNYIH